MRKAQAVSRAPGNFKPGRSGPIPAFATAAHTSILARHARLTFAGRKQVKEKMPGIGGSFTVPDLASLRSPAAAFTRTQAEAIAAASEDTGKQALVFAAAKFINHRSLGELRVDFAQLPYALHRVQAE